MKKYILVFFLILSVTSFPQDAGYINLSNPGNNFFNYGLNTRGVYSLGGNPALLAFPDNKTLEIATLLPIPNINLTLGNDFMSIKDYNYFFSGKTDAEGNKTGIYLNAAEKQKFRDLFSDGTEVNSYFSATLFAATYYNPKIGGIGFSVRDKGSVTASLPEDLVSLFLDGNEISRVYNFDDFSLNSWYMREYALSYGYKIPFETEAVKNISAGFSAKLLHGYTYNSASKFSTSLQTLENNSINVMSDIEFYSAFSNDFGVEYDFDKDSTKTSSFSPFPSPAGKGFALDFGLAMELNDVWSFGLTLSDLGSMSWNKSSALYARKDQFILDDVTDDELLDSLFSSIEPEGKYIDGFKTSLITTLGLGTSFQLDKFLDGNFPGSMTLLIDYRMGLNSSHRSADPAFYGGFEWKPWKWLPLRSGIALGGYSGLGWQFGFGFNLDLFEINFATSNLQTFYATETAKRISLGINTRWKF